jgi:hypothetical protein
VGYVSSKSPGFRALNNLITTVWKCDATLTTHESGWLVYRFKSEDNKLVVLRGGPYLVYGRPLILRLMIEYFDFSHEEMSRVPVWVKFLNLPLKCWSSPTCLSKIASVLGKPIQCDKLTSNLSRLSYARVLIEIDLLEDLQHTVDVFLPNGFTPHQKVVFETLSKFCNHCHVLGHTHLRCPKVAASVNKEIGNPSQAMANKANAYAVQTDKGGVFSRLRPQIQQETLTPTIQQEQHPHP